MAPWLHLVALTKNFLITVVITRIPRLCYRVLRVRFAVRGRHRSIFRVVGLVADGILLAAADGAEGHAADSVAGETLVLGGVAGGETIEVVLVERAADGDADAD